MVQPSQHVMLRYWNRRRVIGALGSVVLGLASLTCEGLDLVSFNGIAGPLSAALTQLASLGPGVKALMGFIGFVVALVSLAGLRNFAPVLFYLGLSIFAAVGLVIAGAIMGAVVPMV